MTLYFFYFFSFIVILSSFLVIFVSNPVHSVLFLIFTFFNAAIIFLIFKAEFLAMTLLIVYVGAVAVLFLFVVMMLDINFIKLREGFLQYLPFGLLLGIVLIIELGILFLTESFNYNNIVEYSSNITIPETENTKIIGQVLYTKYFYLFQICGIILLVAMIGSITLTLRDRGQVKRQDIFKQNNLDASKAIEKKKVKLGEGIL